MARVPIAKILCGVFALLLLPEAAFAAVVFDNGAAGTGSPASISFSISHSDDLIMAEMAANADFDTGGSNGASCTMNGVAMTQLHYTANEGTFSFLSLGALATSSGNVIIACSGNGMYYYSLSAVAYTGTNRVLPTVFNDYGTTVGTDPFSLTLTPTVNNAMVVGHAAAYGNPVTAGANTEILEAGDNYVVWVDSITVQPAGLPVSLNFHNQTSEAGGFVFELDPAAPPTLTPITLASSNSSTTLAKAGDVLTLSFTGNAALHAPSVSILGHATTTAINTSGNTWAASTTVLSGDTQGAAAFLITAANSTQTATSTVSAITSGANVGIDTLAPTITVTGGSVTVAHGATYSDQGATATDAHDGTVSVSSSGSVNTAVPGTYTITYNATDAAGNQATSATRSVTVEAAVVQTTTATASSNGPIFQGSAASLPGYIAPRPQIQYPDGRVVYLDAIPATTTFQNVQSPVSQTAPEAATPATELFTQDRFLWDTGADIKELQAFLNTHGFPIAQTGPGSLGHETSVFGLKTLQALKRFQAANGIPSTGNLGPMTRARIQVVYDAEQ